MSAPGTLQIKTGQNEKKNKRYKATITSIHIDQKQKGQLFWPIANKLVLIL